jgi:aminoglycoside phosphotransferase (APT) family kinase protein
MGGLCVGGEPLTPPALERLRGTPRWTQFATLLARFLRELHSTPLNSLPVELPPAEGREAWEHVYVDVRSRLFDHLSHGARRETGDRFEAFLGEAGNWKWAPVIVHGDFAPHNILYFTSRNGDALLSGIQGWNHAGLGDPSQMSTLAWMSNCHEHASTPVSSRSWQRSQWQTGSRGKQPNAASLTVQFYFHILTRTHWKSLSCMAE